MIELKVPEPLSDDIMPGIRSASVAWHPIQKKYYTAMAGNAMYPLGVFDSKGKVLSKADAITMIDTRGLWYDPSAKLICGNGYKEEGWFQYNLDEKGLITGYDFIIESMHQPEDQSVGAYNAKAKQVLFIKGSTVYFYNQNGEEVDKMLLHIGRTKIQGALNTENGNILSTDYNAATIVFTGIIGQEIGLLNTSKKKVELYDSKTGFLAKTINLPSNVVLDMDNTFGFSYTNTIYWFFDKENRTWKGYK